MEFANLENAHLEQSDFKYVNMTGAYFHDTHLERTTYDNVNLRDARFFHVYLQFSTFENTTLINARIIDESDLTDVVMYDNVLVLSTHFNDSILVNAN